MKNTNLNYALVSVCIPAFNAAKYIEETIYSVLSQDHERIEILISDNHSTDGTWDIVVELAKKSKYIKIIRNIKNVGMTYNWNSVVKMAQGDFVLLLSADDKLDKSFITEALADFASHRDVDIVTCNFFYLEKHRLRKRWVQPISKIYFDFIPLVLQKNPFSINFTLFSRDALKKLKSEEGLFRRNLMTCDYDLWFRIAASDLRIFYDDKSLGIYRCHATNLSNAKLKMMRQTLLVILTQKKYFTKNCFFLYKYLLLKFIVKYLYYVYFLRGFQKDEKLFKLLIKNFITN